MMKKQNLLFAFIILLISTGAQAQDQCCLRIDHKTTASLERNIELITDNEMQAILQEEINHFRNYVASNFEYPELAKDYGLEGEIIVRVIYNKGFENIEITKSINPLIDKMVLDNITEYIDQFDRTYEGAPRMVFEIPINFRMEG